MDALNELETSGGQPMARTKYLTAPLKTTKMPPGVPYIVGNEAAERFSYYGMRAILFVFMTKYLMGANGQPNHMTDAEATKFTHLFFASAYFFPLIGAIIADAFLGKYRTIMTLSIVYCFGHLALALNDTRLGLGIGLGLIAIGSGGIKPCVSSNVGDQFGKENQHLLTRVYNWFYFSINLGSVISMLLIPELLDRFGSEMGAAHCFRNPGIVHAHRDMDFLAGSRKKFVHIPRGGEAFVQGKGFQPATARALLNLLPIYVFIALWWSLYDQSSSRWVEQAERMDLNFLGHAWKASQVQAINPLLVLKYNPLITYVIYPTVNQIFPLNQLRKISMGFFFAVMSFVVPAWVETQISAGLHPTIAWQLLAYVFLMASEVLIYATGLEFSYTQAPKQMKSMIMSFFLATNSAGNLFTAAVNSFIQNKDGSVKLAGANYYLFFAGLMFLAAIIFIFVALRYQGKSFIQDDREGLPEGASS